MEDVDAMLDEVPSRVRRFLSEELEQAIAYFLERKYQGDPRAHVSLFWFYTNKLRPKYKGPSMNMVYRHVREVMKLDIRTGGPL